MFVTGSDFSADFGVTTDGAAGNFSSPGGGVGGGQTLYSSPFSRWGAWGGLCTLLPVEGAEEILSSPPKMFVRGMPTGGGGILEQVS